MPLAVRARLSALDKQMRAGRLRDHLDNIQSGLAELSNIITHAYVEAPSASAS
jgi:hypothetical protein